MYLNPSLYRLPQHNAMPMCSNPINWWKIHPMTVWIEIMYLQNQVIVGCHPLNECLCKSKSCVLLGNGFWSLYHWFRKPYYTFLEFHHRGVYNQVAGSCTRGGDLPLLAVPDTSHATMWLSRIFNPTFPNPPINNQEWCLINHAYTNPHSWLMPMNEMSISCPYCNTCQMNNFYISMYTMAIYSICT